MPPYAALALTDVRAGVKSAPGAGTRMASHARSGRPPLRHAVNPGTTRQQSLCGLCASVPARCCSTSTAASWTGMGPVFDDLLARWLSRGDFREYLTGCWPRGLDQDAGRAGRGWAADQGAASGGPASTDLKVRRQLRTGAPPRTRLPCLSPCLGRHDHTF
jgi:hypothetical protein